MKLLAPSTGAVEVATDRREYKGRIIEVTDRADIKDLRAIGYTVASAAGPTARVKGFECPVCAFSSFFRLCGRCGNTID
jgi:hypothetical protein